MFGKKKVEFNVLHFMPHFKTIGEFLKSMVDQYYAWTFAGYSVNADQLAQWLVDTHIKTWRPLVAGKELLDEPTKLAGARFLAGLALNYIKAQGG